MSEAPARSDRATVSRSWACPRSSAEPAVASHHPGRQEPGELRADPEVHPTSRERPKDDRPLGADARRRPRRRRRRRRAQRTTSPAGPAGCRPGARPARRRQPARSRRPGGDEPDRPPRELDQATVVADERAGVEATVVVDPTDLGEVDDPPPPAGASDVHDEVDRRGDLLADHAEGEVDVAHEHHRLEPAEGLDRPVGVARGQRALVPGVHRLQHVERLAGADLADDDAIGPHAQGVADEVADGDLARALGVGGRASSRPRARRAAAARRRPRR